QLAQSRYTDSDVRRLNRISWGLLRAYSRARGRRIPRARSRRRDRRDRTRGSHVAALPGRRNPSAYGARYAVRDLAGIGWRRGLVLTALADPPFALLQTGGFVFAPGALNIPAAVA